MKIEILYLDKFKFEFEEKLFTIYLERLKKISKKQLKEIAEKKMADLNAHDVEEAAKIIAGSARSMGIEVKD